MSAAKPRIGTPAPLVVMAAPKQTHSEPEIDVVIVRACQRGGIGGSPTAVLRELPLSNAARCALPGLVGASHAVFVTEARLDAERTPSFRFFTAAGELPSCGHGTLAGLGVLALRSRGGVYRDGLRVASGALRGHAEMAAGRGLATYDAGPVTLRQALPAEYAPAMAALGLRAADLRRPPVLATLGSTRVLIELREHRALAGLEPDHARLRSACLAASVIGCYVYTPPPAPASRVQARMFAPTAGVPEDIANANGAACLAASLACGESVRIEVDMGDSLGSPSRVVAEADPGRGGPPSARLFGAVASERTVRLPAAALRLER